MEAVRIDDAGAPARLAVWLTAFGWVVGLAGFLVLTETPGKVEATPAALGLLGCALALAAPRIARLRPSTRRARLVVEPGRVVLGRAVLRREELVGAVVAQDEPPVLALARGKAPPLFVTFARAADLEAVCRELGVGPRACGTLRFVGPPGPAARLLELQRLCGAAILVGLAASDAAPLLLVLALWPLGPVLLLLALLLERAAPSLELGPNGLVERTRWRRRRLRYDEVVSVDEPLRHLLGPRVPPGSLVAAAVRARVEAARRERTSGREDPRWSLLRRRGGGSEQREDAGAWIARLDQLAATSTGQSAGYRDATLDSDALHDALVDRELDLELRCASARVLARRRALGAPGAPGAAPAILAEVEPTLRARLAPLLEASPSTAEVERSLAGERA